MTSKAKLDAAMAAVRPLVDADIAKGEQMAGIFRARIDQAIKAHRAEIDAYVSELLNAGIDAADKVV